MIRSTLLRVHVERPGTAPPGWTWVTYHDREHAICVPIAELVPVPDVPDGLAEFAAHVMASDSPAVVVVDRTLMRAVLEMVRVLGVDI